MNIGRRINGQPLSFLIRDIKQNPDDYQIVHDRANDRKWLQTRTGEIIWSKLDTGDQEEKAYLCSIGDLRNKPDIQESCTPLADSILNKDLLTRPVKLASSASRNIPRTSASSAAPSDRLLEQSAPPSVPLSLPQHDNPVPSHPPSPSQPNYGTGASASQSPAAPSNLDQRWARFYLDPSSPLEGTPWSINQILAMSEQELENNHGIIQLLFPNTQQGLHHTPDTPLLTLAIAQMVQNNPVIREQVLRVLDRVLSHWGIQRNGNSFQLVHRGWNHYERWLPPPGGNDNDHNKLRISRVLSFCDSCGLPQGRALNQFMQEQRRINYLPPCDHWNAAVGLAAAPVQPAPVLSPAPQASTTASPPTANQPTPPVAEPVTRSVTNPAPTATHHPAPHTVLSSVSAPPIHRRRPQSDRHTHPTGMNPATRSATNPVHPAPPAPRPPAPQVLRLPPAPGHKPSQCPYTYTVPALLANDSIGEAVVTDDNYDQVLNGLREGGYPAQYHHRFNDPQGIGSQQGAVNFYDGQYDRANGLNNEYLTNTYMHRGPGYHVRTFQIPGDPYHYKSAEHCFQSKKFSACARANANHQEVAKAIQYVLSADTGGEAARRGKENGHLIDFDKWEANKRAIMREAIKAKFDAFPELSQRLINTYPNIIIEDTSTQPPDRIDSNWGSGIGNSGSNMTGIILGHDRQERIRRQLT